MKKLYRNILLFLVPLLALLLLIPVNQRLKYTGLKHDCFNHGIWIYDRIFNNNKSVDVAFFGSSHTINDVDDHLIEKHLAKKLTVANFGYCRLGRNLSYVLLKELLKKKHPRYVFLEVREDEDYFSHPIFPYVASDRDVLFPYLLFDAHYFSDIWTHFSYKTELLQDALFSNENGVPVRDNAFGHSAFRDTVSPGVLAKVYREQNSTKEKPSKLIRDFHLAFARGYLKAIGRLCEQEKIKLIFLYLPSYGSGLKRPKERATYAKYGDVWLPPKKIFNKAANWHDSGHLNREGARELSLWLAKRMNRDLLLQKGRKRLTACK
jgi:hypothetical protein